MITVCFCGRDYDPLEWGSDCPYCDAESTLPNIPHRGERWEARKAASAIDEEWKHFNQLY